MTDTQRAERIKRLGYDYEHRSTEEVADCNLCGSTHHVEVARRDRYGFPAVLRVCARCGLGFLSPRLTASEYAEFYAHIYRPLVSAYHGRLIDRDTVQDEQRAYAVELSQFLQRHVSACPRDLLDIGGSTGVVADGVCRVFGCSATVLDPAPDELAVAEAAGMGTIEGFVEDFDPGERRWDLVLLCQTIDHLLDVASTLSAIRGLLADDGHAFIDVLDVEFMARRRGSIEGAVKIDHPYYLTRITARAFFDQAGLGVVGERLSDDGHWGFLVEAAEPREPDWARLSAAADASLDRLSTLRAG